jgi:O-methyltransferase
MASYITGTGVRILRKIEEVRGRFKGTPNMFGLPWEVPQTLFNLIRLARPYTMVEPMRLAMLYGLANEICNSPIKGAIVECGVCQGGSAMILAAAIKNLRDRKLWLYDTFEGLPAPGPRDGQLAREFEGKLRGSIRTVQEVIGKAGLPLERVVLRKGPFRDTFSQPLPQKVALLHIDADWYDSVIDCLRTFYPLVVTGGVIVLDDFGHWEGAREAFYDFCTEQNVKPLIERVGYTQMFWRKEMDHNRAISDSYACGVYQPRFR